MFCDCKNSPLQGVDFTVCLQRAPLASQLQSLALGEVSGLAFFFSSLLFFSPPFTLCLTFYEFLGFSQKCLLVLSVPLSVSSNNYPRPASFQNLIKICFEIQRQSLSLTHTQGLQLPFSVNYFLWEMNLLQEMGRVSLKSSVLNGFLGWFFFGFFLVTDSTDQ